MHIYVYAYICLRKKKQRVMFFKINNHFHEKDNEFDRYLNYFLFKKNCVIIDCSVQIKFDRPVYH